MEQIEGWEEIEFLELKQKLVNGNMRYQEELSKRLDKAQI